MDNTNLATYLSTNPLAGLRRSCVQLVGCRYGLAAGPDIAATAGHFGVAWVS